MIMGLSKLDKSTLEEIIADAKSHIPREKVTFENIKVRNLMGIYDLEEFLFGMIYGEITTHFEDYYFSKYQRTPDKSEINEIVEILTNKLKDIREIINDEIETWH